VITAGWAFAVFIGAFCSAAQSGAHLNPAVTIAMVAAGKLESYKLAGYLIAQMLGGIIGGALVYFFYREHFKVTEDGDAKLACFSTAPNIRSLGQSLFCEIVGTFLLILPIFLMTPAVMKLPNVEGSAEVGLGTIGLIPVALLVFAIGLSLGGTTGYAINPARDLGPRLAHALLPIPGKRDSDWGYAWVPVAGPIIGGLLAAWLHSAMR
jgi:glycerol uptake facilitator protein